MAGETPEAAQPGQTLGGLGLVRHCWTRQRLRQPAHAHISAFDLTQKNFQGGGVPGPGFGFWRRAIFFLEKPLDGPIWGGGAPVWHAGRMGEPSVGSRKEEGGAQGIKSSPSATPYPPQSRKVSSAHSEEAERQGGRTPGLLRTRQGQGREGPAITIQSNPGKESKASFPIHTSPAERGMRKNPKESARQREREGEGAQTREGERGRESSPKAWGALVAVFQPAPLPPPPRQWPGAGGSEHRTPAAPADRGHSGGAWPRPGGCRGQPRLFCLFFFQCPGGQAGGCRLKRENSPRSSMPKHYEMAPK